MHQAGILWRRKPFRGKRFDDECILTIIVGVCCSNIARAVDVTESFAKHPARSPDFEVTLQQADRAASCEVPR